MTGQLPGIDYMSVASKEPFLLELQRAGLDVQKIDDSSAFGEQYECSCGRAAISLWFDTDSRRPDYVFVLTGEPSLWRWLTTRAEYSALWKVVNHAMETHAISEPYPITIPGLQCSADDRGRVRIVLEDATSRESIEALIRELPSDRLLTFYDASYPGSQSDPGQYVTISRDGGTWTYYCGNHGWQSPKRTISSEDLAEWLYRCRSENSHASRGACVEIWPDTGKEPSRGRPIAPDSTAAMLGLLVLAMAVLAVVLLAIQLLF